MSITIYTYSDPYEIKREAFWDKIKNCSHFCVSQTMVNGLTDIYPALGNQLTTLRIFLNSLYKNWEDMNTKVKQIMEVDNAINKLNVVSENGDNIKRSLEYNTKSLVSCIRIFKELNLEPENFNLSKLNIDQMYLIEIYKIICKREKSSFKFERVESENEINIAIENALKHKHKNSEYNNIDYDTVVIHGVHQFSPAMLCAIEDVSKYKNVILLFNYQEQYSEIYKTWLNIYSLFEEKISISNDNVFTPMSLLGECYPCNVLADNFGSLANGEFKDSSDILSNVEIIEFENLTEFAGYCAMLFETARERKKRHHDLSPALKYMPEQLYSASGKVNDILRAYFPEQFGERHFLDYPIGHFFVSAVEMWDNDKKNIKVDNVSSIKECLSAGIISEKRSGQLLSTFNTVESYIIKESTLSGIIKKLSKLKKYVGNQQDDFHRIGYMNLPKSELVDLIKALKELEEIIKYFFVDFDEGGDNFNRFYQRIHDFIVRRTDQMDKLDEEMKDVISRLLDRMSRIDLPDTGTFVCLKETMSFYLSQDDTAGLSANWIVRDFEQIDGDILRSRKQTKYGEIYHFCCLSDKDICAAKDERLPWPLDINFFEYSYEPLDQKYQIFLRSKLEFKNFKNYALLYGLTFNRVGYKLSYVKNENNKDNEIFHIFRILGIKPKKYRSENTGVFVPRIQYPPIKLNDVTDFSDVDYIRYNMCPYKFAVESIVQGETIYRDRFLIIFYMRAYLENNIIKKYQGQNLSNMALREAITEEYNNLDDKFRISNEYEKTQIISGVYQYFKKIIKKESRLPRITPNIQTEMDYKKDFLTLKSKDLDNSGDSSELIDMLENDYRYYSKYSHDCMYCASKDVCLQFTEQS